MTEVLPPLRNRPWVVNVTPAFNVKFAGEALLIFNVVTAAVPWPVRVAVVCSYLPTTVTVKPAAPPAWVFENAASDPAPYVIPRTELSVVS